MSIPSFGDDTTGEPAPYTVIGETNVDGVAAGETSTQAVTFPAPFDARPVVLAQITDANPGDRRVWASDITRTGATLNVHNAGEHGYLRCAVAWAASGV